MCVWKNKQNNNKQVNKVYFKLFPGYSIKQTLKKLFCDEFLDSPFHYFPMFYFGKELFKLGERKLGNDYNAEHIMTHLYLNMNYGIQASGFKLLNEIKEAWWDGMARYGETWFQDNVACWAFWIPVQFFNFKVLPMHLRAPFMTVVSFTWYVCLYLS